MVELSICDVFNVSIAILMISGKMTEYSVKIVLLEVFSCFLYINSLKFLYLMCLRGHEHL